MASTCTFTCFIALSSLFCFLAVEMTRADRVTILLQDRQDKDIRKINEVKIK